MSQVSTRPLQGRSNAAVGMGWVILAILFGLAFLAAAGSYVVWQRPSAKMNGVPLLSFTIWVCTLAGFWLAFGQRPWRFLVLPLPALAALLLNWLVGGNELAAFLCFFIGIQLVVALTGGALRWRVGELRRDATSEAKDALQFDLRHVFGVTTGVALFFGVGRALNTLSSWSMASDTAMIVGALVLAIALKVVVSIWALLGQRVSTTRLVVLVGSILSAGAVVAVVSQGTRDRIFWSSVIIAEQCLMIGTLLCVRLENYRFVKR